MDVHLLTSLDRALQQRARSNAAAGLREGEQHAAERLAAAHAVAQARQVRLPR